jgi:hypothetical protein
MLLLRKINDISLFLSLCAKRPVKLKPYIIICLLERLVKQIFYATVSLATFSFFCCAAFDIRKPAV